MRSRNSLKHTTIVLAFLGVFVANLLLQKPWLGAALLVVFLIFFGWQAGALVAPKEQGAVQWFFGVWVLLCGLLLVGTGVYYLHSFPPWLGQALVLLTPGVLWLIAGKEKRHAWFDRAHDLLAAAKHRVPGSVWIASALVLLFLFVTFQTLVDAATTEAVRSAWDVVPKAALLPFFLAILLLASLLLRGRERTLSLPLVALTLLLFLSVAVIVFPLGFGFDRFIHQATEQHIAQFGSISPKPFYSIGQYVLVLIAQHAFFLPIAWTDTLLVPVLTALLLPLAWYAAASHIFENRATAAASLLGLFLLPLSSFIVTTPQALANLWTLLLVLASVPYLLKRERPGPLILALPALATVAIHPIAGIPAVLLIALLAADPALFRERLRPAARFLFWIIAALGSFLLPASFLLNKILSGQPLALSAQGLTPSNLWQSLHLELFFENRFSPLLDFVYLFGFNAAALLLLFALLGIWMRRNQARSLLTLLVLAVMLLINYLLLSTAVDFSFLIDYERQNYASRLIPLALFVLIPLLLLGFGSMMERLRTGPILLKGFAALLLAGVITSALYLSYPRHDAYERSGGFNVSQYDVDAVYAIEQAAQGAPYMALANQSVSAAALEHVGFRYYREVFFYPIPTGETLYQFFLQMNEQPSAETAQAALAYLATHCADACESVPKKLYYIVDDYWWQAPRIVETAKSVADHWFALGGGKVHVFEFLLDD